MTPTPQQQQTSSIYHPMNDIELYMDLQKKFAEQKIFMSFTNPGTVQNVLIILSLSQAQVNALPKQSSSIQR